jgi:hypothetical protein
MDIKNGYYVFFNNQLLKMYHSMMEWEIISNDLSLVKYGFIRQDDYCYKIIKKSEDINDFGISGFLVQTFCIYKGGEYNLSNIVKDIVVLDPDLETKKKLGFHIYDDISVDVQYEKFINEVEEIWEERTPIKGFKFDVEPIHYIKKNRKYFEYEKITKLETREKVFDKFQGPGNISGYYASPVYGTEEIDNLYFTYDSRSLKYNIEEKTNYIKFKFKDNLPPDLKFEYGEVIPWFGKHGLGDQVRSSIDFRELRNYIEIVEQLEYREGKWIKIK